MLKKKKSSLSHKVKLQYSLSLKLASDDDIKWLYNITTKEYNKRYGSNN